MSERKELLPNKGIDKGDKVTYKSLYEKVKKFKMRYYDQPEPILWFTYAYDSEEDEKVLKVHFGTIDEYRYLGYGENNDPEELIYSIGTGAVRTLTQELGSESIKSVRDHLYTYVHSLDEEEE